MSSRSAFETPSARSLDPRSHLPTTVATVRRCSSSPVRVVLVDAESIFRASLRQLLSIPSTVVKDVYGVDIGAGFRVVGEAGSGDEMTKVVQSTQPELLLVDLSMPGMSRLAPLTELESISGGNIRAILLARSIQKSQLLESVQVGVRGVILKTSPTELMFEAMSCVVAGQYWLGQSLVSDLIETVRPLIESSKAIGGKLAFGLTAREHDVVAMVVSGWSNREIAAKYTISEETIKHHLTHIFEKVGASNRLELAMIATQRGISSPP